jgi:predicted ATPase
LLRFLKNNVDSEIVELNRKRYQAAKGSVKRAISRAQETVRSLLRSWVKRIRNEMRVRVAKQIVKQNRYCR